MYICIAKLPLYIIWQEEINLQKLGWVNSEILFGTVQRNQQLYSLQNKYKILTLLEDIRKRHGVEKGVHT